MRSAKKAYLDKLVETDKSTSTIWKAINEIIIIITYIYNALNDALSASRIHNKLKTILSKYIHIHNRQS